MSEVNVEDVPLVSLPSPLPARYPSEPQELTVYRRDPGNGREFLKLRRDFRDAEDWRALATLLTLHSAQLGRDDQQRNKAAELSLQAYELWLERVKDREAAAHALARAVILRPENGRALERLRKLYETLGSYKDLVALLRWKLRSVPGEAAAAMHFELAELLEQHFVAIGEAVEHYEATLRIDPTHAAAGDRMVRLYLQAGAWPRASALLREQIARLEPGDPSTLAALHRTLARIEADQLDDVASAARSLQAALRLVPDDIDALRAFGMLYLSSGHLADDGVTKAADIFFKAADIARRRSDPKRALKLLRRALSLAPDHPQAGSALEATLIDTEDWLALDELYREWLLHASGADAVPLLLRRADVLYTHLYRREEARQLYEKASRYQRPDEESWRRLEQIYSESGDHHSLAALLDAQVERMPNEVPTDTLLRAARVYREELGLEERAAVYYYRVLEREPFNTVAFEGYKEHWRRKHNWGHLRDLVLYQIEQATAFPGDQTPLADPEFAEEFVELADICERRLGDIDSALDAWARLAAAYPQDPRPTRNIGRIEKRARMWDNMVRVQEAELERTIDPTKRLDILKRLTQVYRDRQVNPARAVELYTEILEVSPNDVQASRALTALYDRSGEYARVVEMLRGQYEHSRSTTERIAVLRRMAELWHHELDAPQDAIWACEQILSHAVADREALDRLQQILEDEEDWPALHDALLRELRAAGSADAKAKCMRRLARLAEREMGDDELAVQHWSALAALRPLELELIDKLLAAHERLGQHEQTATLLSKAAASTATPQMRQVDYLLRLGRLAETHLDDPGLARASFENTLRIRPDLRIALDALVRIYRREDAWQPLLAVLGKLQELAEVDEDAFRIAWERAEILGGPLADAASAAEVLETLMEVSGPSRAELAERLLDLYERAGQHRNAVRQAETMLLATTKPEERRRLFRIICETWRLQLKDVRAALSAQIRHCEEFADDLEGLRTLAELQLEIDDPEAALRTLDRRLHNSGSDLTLKTTTLELMAEIARTRLSSAERGLQYLRLALALDPFNTDLIARVRSVAEAHALWETWLEIEIDRFGYHATAGDRAGQIAVCSEAATIAEDHAGDPRRAFEWARRGYVVAIESQHDAAALLQHLERLAADHQLWPDLLALIAEEIGHFDAKGAIADGSYDAVGRLLTAADIAERKMRDPDRTIGLLQDAYALRAGDVELGQRLERAAERHKRWPALIDLWQDRRHRASTDAERHAACVAIARIYEDELSRADEAFGWLQTIFLEQRESSPRLAADAYRLLVELADRQGLWPMLCEHHLDRADEACSTGNSSAALAAFSEAAQIFDVQMGDPLSAFRVLAAAVDVDPTGATVLPVLRRLSEALDEASDGDAPKLGGLLLLEVLERLCARAEQESARDSLIVAHLTERARVRVDRLRDPEGAMAEWLRVLQVDSESELAHIELERLADEHALWNKFLLLLAWQLENNPDRARRRLLYQQLARAYEGPLARPEYALRARLTAWRLDPTLPTRDVDLDDEHAALWRLAGATGTYQTPPVPKDPLLRPAIAPPEFRDQRLWSVIGLDPRRLQALPSAHAAKLERTSAAAIPGVIRDAVSLTAWATVSDEFVEPDPDDHEPTDALGGGMVSGDTSDDADTDSEVVELDLAELEMVEITEVTVVHSEPGAGPARPPPPPRPRGVGLPPLPKLHRPVVPPRPRVASAWDEVALAYAEAAPANKAAQADVALVLARLWEDGAQNVERAFQAHERALMFVPEQELALASLRALAERHDSQTRLLSAYERLLADATMPEHLVELGLRVAREHESRADLTAAERSYRGVLTVVPRHVEPLRALCKIYEAQQRSGDYVEMFAELLEAEAGELSDDELVHRNLKLGRLLAERGGRRKEAIERLDQLVRRFPERPETHAALIDLLVAGRHWQQAIEAMRVANSSTTEESLQVENLVKIAAIYEEKLALPDRAIAAWQEVATRSDDERALSKLQQLYLQTSRFEPALPIIERRLARLGDDPASLDARISLLVAKARVLQEGPGGDAAATETLEQLLRVAPDNDEVALGLHRLYRRMGRLGEGIALIRRRWESLDDAETDRYIEFTRALCVALDRDAHDPKSAMDVAKVALENHPRSPELLRMRAALARALHDLPVLAESLIALGDLDSMLEAAEIMLRPGGDRKRSLRIYSRVLADAKKDPDDPENARRLACALEGLVRLRVEDGDSLGAMEFLDRQLTEISGHSIRAQLLTEMGRIIHRSTGDVDAANQRFDAALAEDPSYAHAKVGKAEMLIETGDTSEAERLLTEAVDALSLTPSYERELVDGLGLLARVLQDSGRSGDAYRRLASAARHAPDNLEIRSAIVRNRVAANRHRDAVVAADQLEQVLRDGFERTPQNVRVVAEILVIAAESERHLRRPDDALARFRRAAALDPENLDALPPLIEMCEERGFLGEAARHSTNLARATQDPLERARRYVDAARLFHDAASSIADGAAPEADETEVDLRTAAFENLRMALDLADEAGGFEVGPAALELAFRSAAHHDPQLALRCLEALLGHERVTDARRADLCLQGVRLALAADDLEAAERYATTARASAPHASAAVLAQARVLEAGERLEEIEDLVEGYFRHLGGNEAADAEVSARVTLLVRLAELQRAHPEKAIASLERASELDPSALTVDDRRTLAELYAQTETQGHAVLANYAALLRGSPLHVPSLAALGSARADQDDLVHAWAIYQTLAYIDPDHADANAFLSRHEQRGVATGELALDGLEPAAIPDAGIGEALAALWDGGASLLTEQLPRIDVAPEARISPMGDSLLARTWAEVLKRLGQTKVALVDTASVEHDDASQPGGLSDGGYFEVRCQHPPVILVHPWGRDCDDPAELRFALGRATYLTRPECLFAAGLRRGALADLVSATLLAFHPRHARRKHHQRSDDPIARLGQELARKLPMRVSRRLTSGFKEHEAEGFDSTQWRNRIRATANCVGLALAGDLDAALRVLGRSAPRAIVLERIDRDDELRSIVAFAISAEYAQARRQLGYRVEPRT